MKQKHSLKQYVLLTVLVLSGLFSVSAAKFAVYFDCEYNFNDQTCQLKSAAVREVSANLTMAHGPEYDDRNIAALDLSSPIIYNDTQFSITSIDGNALKLVSITELTLPAHLDNVKEGFLSYCPKLEKVIIAAGASGVYYTSDDNQALYTTAVSGDKLIWVGSALTSYEISANVNPANYAFFNAYSLKDLSVHPDNKQLVVENGMLLDIAEKKLITILPFVTVFKLNTDVNSVAEGFINAKTPITEAEISAFFPTEGYKTLRSSCCISKVKFFGDNIRIPEQAFKEDFALTDLSFENPISDLGNESFFGCEELKYLVLPGIKNTGSKAFANCHGLQTVTINADIPTTLGENMFMNCAHLEELTINGNNVQELPRSFAEGCTKLNKVILPESCEWLKPSALFDCRLATFIAPGLKSVETMALWCEELDLNTLPPIRIVRTTGILTTKYMETFTLPASITYFEEEAITASVNILTLNSDATLRQRMLNIDFNTLVLRENQKTFSPYIFSEAEDWHPQKIVITNMEVVKVIPLSGIPGTIYEDTTTEFYQSWTDNTTLYVPDNLVETYKQEEGWKAFKNIRPLSESGVEDLTADGNGLDFEVADGVVTVNGEEGQSVEIYSLDGKRVAAGMTGQPLNVGKGLHIIRCGSAAKKVMVK